MSEERNESSDHDRTALLETIHRHLLGDLDAAQFVKLESELQRSPELRAHFLRAVRMDAILHEEALHLLSQPEEKVINFRPLRWLAAGAAVMVCAGFWWLRPQKVPVTQTVIEELATIIDTRDCQWATLPPVLLQGRLPAGRLNLTAGVALIEFDDGARLALQGPAVLELNSANSARLHAGHATVRCEDGGEGFSLLTPTSTVTDLGTEFGVSVTTDGTTAVEVLDGEVEVLGAARQTTSTTLLLTAGQIVKLNPDGSTSRTTKSRTEWVRDYTSKAEREERTQPPRLMAHDWFPHGGVKLPDYTGGLGWSGPWTTVTNDPGSSIAFVPLEPITPRTQKQEGAISLGESMEVQRRLAQPLNPELRQRVYVAFSLHRLIPDAIEKTGRRGAATLLLRSSGDPATHLSFGLSGHNQWVASDKNSWEKSGQATPSTGPFFVVARIDIRPNLGNQIAVVGYAAGEPIPNHAPKKWDLITRRVMTSGSHPLDIIALRALNPGGTKFANVCIGNSWQSVTMQP